MLKCPNLCFNGRVQSFPDETKALYNLVNCPYCKGRGEVLEKDYNKINKLI